MKPHSSAVATMVALLATVAAATAAKAATAPAANTASRSTTQPRSLLLNVGRGSLGRLRLGQAAAFYQHLLGQPSDVEPLPSGPIMSWYSKTGLWVAVAFNDDTERDATSIYYAAPMHTSRGDKIGTPLATFLKHWPNAQKADTWWSRSYHVQNTWFHFNGKGRLFAVELGDRSVTLAHAPKSK